MLPLLWEVGRLAVEGELSVCFRDAEQEPAARRVGEVEPGSSVLDRWQQGSEVAAVAHGCGGRVLQRQRVRVGRGVGEQGLALFRDRVEAGPGRGADG
ncbi:hypothetical protein BG418_04405 [Streptomyces sp. CBMA152]|nr:hypothetical protein [Streptomyces sp. CBMA152]MBD0748004.1 hypothetical protein [Streptomyces sp. CBMA152]